MTKRCEVVPALVFESDGTGGLIRGEVVSTGFHGQWELLKLVSSEDGLSRLKSLKRGHLLSLQL